MDAELIADLFQMEGASQLDWEQATRCDCYSEDSRQPEWGCQSCGGFGAVYADPVRITGLFRSQGRWVSPKSFGELDHGEAQLTLPIEHKPGFTDHRVRDRFTVVNATGDLAAGRVFYPAGPATPFMFGDQAHAWRVQLQSLEQRDRELAQP